MSKPLSSWLSPLWRSRIRGAGADRSQRITLRTNEHWKVIRSAAASPIRCLQGKVWITVAGRREDIVLTPGHVWRPDSNGVAVVGALLDSELCVGSGECA